MNYDVTEPFPCCWGDGHPFSFDHHGGPWLNAFPFGVDDNFLLFIQSRDDKFLTQEEF